MRAVRVGLVVVVLLTASLRAQTPPAPDTPTADTAPHALTVAPSPPALSEVERLRVENHILRVLLMQLTTQAQTVALSQERDQLEATVVAAHPGWRMDWTTGQLVPASTPAEETPPR
jgi:hypothetical protein